jgi:lambda repressor-like predicted transcriptional regulator
MPMNYPCATSSGMVSENDIRRAALRSAMERAGINVHGWSKAAGVPASTIYSYLDGKTRSLREDTARRLATAIGLTLDQLYDEQSTAHTKWVWVKGLVGAGAVVTVMDGVGLNEGLYEVALPPGAPADLEYVAFEIRGFSMPPAQERWIIYCLDRQTFQPDEVLGRACVVELSDGKLMFKVVRRGYSAGAYNLESWDGSPLIEDVQIVRAMPFVSIADPHIVRK